MSTDEQAIRNLVEQWPLASFNVFEPGDTVGASLRGRPGFDWPNL